MKDSELKSNDSQQRLPTKKDSRHKVIKKSLEDSAYIVRQSRTGAAKPNIEIPNEIKCDVERITSEHKHIIECFRFIPPASTKHTIFYVPGTGSAAFCPEPEKAICANLAKKLSCQVIAIFHRVGPSAQYPEPVNDVCNVINAYLSRCVEYAIDPHFIALAGYSSGGLIAIQLCIENLKQGSMPFCQLLLIAPITNLDVKKKRDYDNDAEFVTEGFFKSMVYAYVPPTLDSSSSALSPTEHPSSVFSGFPPTTIVSGSKEFIFKDVEDFHNKLKTQNVAVKWEILEGANHSFPWNTVEYIDKIKDVIEHRFNEGFKKSFKYHAPTLRPILDLEGNTDYILFQVPFPNIYFAGRINILTEIDQEFLRGNRVVLQGQQGVGKTEIAKHFICSHKRFKIRVWFHGANIRDLQDQYKDFGLTHQIILGDEDPKTMIDKIKSWFVEKKEWLIVYDNILNLDVINEYVPVVGGHVLMTSHQLDLQCPSSYGLIKIEQMDHEDYMEFVKNRFDKKLFQENIDTIKIILNLFNFHMLGIALAVSYIANTKENITDFVNIFNSRYAEIKSEMTHSRNHLPVPEDLFSQQLRLAILWELCIEAIKQRSIVAYYLINCFAYLTLNSIPGNNLIVFAKAFDAGIEPLQSKDAFECLTSFSTLSHNFDSQTYSIHPLLQNIIGCSHTKADRWLEQVLNVINEDKESILGLGGIAARPEYNGRIIEAYQFLLAESKTSELYQGLAYCLLWDGRLDESQAAFQSGIALLKSVPRDQQNPSIYSEYGYALFMMGKYRKAIVQMKRAIQVNQHARENLFHYFSDVEIKTMDEDLRKEIQKAGLIRVRSLHLAYYVICKCYLSLNEMSSYQKYFYEFGKIATSVNDYIVKKLYMFVQEQAGLVQIQVFFQNRAIENNLVEKYLEEQLRVLQESRGPCYFLFFSNKKTFQKEQVLKQCVTDLQHQGEDLDSVAYVDELLSDPLITGHRSCGFFGLHVFKSKSHQKLLELKKQLNHLDLSPGSQGI